MVCCSDCVSDGLLSGSTVVTVSDGLLSGSTVVTVSDGLLSGSNVATVSDGLLSMKVYCCYCLMVYYQGLLQ